MTNLFTEFHYSDIANCPNILSLQLNSGMEQTRIRDRQQSGDRVGSQSADLITRLRKLLSTRRIGGSTRPKLVLAAPLPPPMAPYHLGCTIEYAWT